MTEIPYQSVKSTIVEDIAKLVEAKKVTPRQLGRGGFPIARAWLI